MYYYNETKLWSGLGVSFFEFIVNSSAVSYQFRNVTILNKLHIEFMTNVLTGGLKGFFTLLQGCVSAVEQ